MGFVEDEEFGDSGEQLALSYLEYDTYQRAPKRRFKDWDFWVESNGIREFWEVKYDRYTHKSGNIVIEFESSGEISGIAATKADKWMYILNGEPTIFMIPVTDLKQMIAEKRYDSIRRIAEYGKNKAYFFNRDLFTEYEYSVE